jgi:hypothetical protein
MDQTSACGSAAVNHRLKSVPLALKNKKGVIAGKIWEFFGIGCINVPVNLSFAE